VAINRISPTDRARAFNSSSVHTRYARQRARLIATLSRLRENKKSALRIMSAPVITGASLVTMVVAGPAGALVALIAQSVARRWRLRRRRHLVSINATQIARDEETLAPPALAIAHWAVERTANHNCQPELAA
jgi:hypothetical protein